VSARIAFVGAGASSSPRTGRGFLGRLGSVPRPHRAREDGSAPEPPRTPGRLQGERQTHHANRVCEPGGPAGNPRAERATSDKQRQAAQLLFAKPGGHCHPGGVQLARRGRRAPPGDPVRLLHQPNADSLRECRIFRRHEVGSLDSSPSPMTEQQPGARPVCVMQMDPREPCRTFHFQHSHATDADKTDREGEAASGGSPPSRW
jgi:hypothetical protein